MQNVKSKYLNIIYKIIYKLNACSQGKHPDFMMLIIWSPHNNKLRGTTGPFFALSEITFKHLHPSPPLKFNRGRAVGMAHFTTIFYCTTKLNKLNNYLLNIHINIEKLSSKQKSNSRSKRGNSVHNSQKNP